MEKERNFGEYLEEWVRINTVLTRGLARSNALLEAAKRNFLEPVSRMAESSRLMSGHFQQLEELRRGLEGEIEKK